MADNNNVEIKITTTANTQAAEKTAQALKQVKETAGEASVESGKLTEAAKRNAEGFNNAAASSANLASTLSTLRTVWAGMLRAAYLLPGIGIAGMLGGIATALANLAGKAQQAQDSLNLKIPQKTDLELAKVYGQATVKIREFRQELERLASIRESSSDRVQRMTRRLEDDERFQNEESDLLMNQQVSMIDLAVASGKMSPITAEKRKATISRKFSADKIQRSRKFANQRKGLVYAGLFGALAEEQTAANAYNQAESALRDTRPPDASKDSAEYAEKSKKDLEERVKLVRDAITRYEISHPMMAKMEKYSLPWAGEYKKYFGGDSPETFTKKLLLGDNSILEKLKTGFTGFSGLFQSADYAVLKEVLPMLEGLLQNAKSQSKTGAQIFNDRTGNYDAVQKNFDIKAADLTRAQQERIKLQRLFPEELKDIQTGQEHSERLMGIKSGTEQVKSDTEVEKEREKKAKEDAQRRKQLDADLNKRFKTWMGKGGGGIDILTSARGADIEEAKARAEYLQAMEELVRDMVTNSIQRKQSDTIDFKASAARINMLHSQARKNPDR